MANSPPQQRSTGRDLPNRADPTFRTNTTAQAEAYQAGRAGYAKVLIDELLAHHTITGGKFNTILDVGCGPGTATRSLSPHFQIAYACDPSESMIATAKGIPSTTKSGDAVSYAVGPAEELGQIPLSPQRPAPGSRFHRSNNPRRVRPLVQPNLNPISAQSQPNLGPISAFYAAAAPLLRPDGTLAMGTCSSCYCHPHMTPTAEKVQRILFDLERRILAPYEMPGNRVSADAHENLPLPWSSDLMVVEFDESMLVRKEWNRDGEVEKGQPFLALEPRYSLDDFAKGFSTVGMVVRWRAAHKDQLEKREVEDCVDLTVRRLSEAQDGRDWIDGGPSTVLLMIKKKA